MAKTKVAFDDLLAVATRGELRCVLSTSRLPPTLPEAQRLAADAAALCPAASPLRLGIVHSCTSNLLDPWLEIAAALQGLKLETYHAPDAFTFQEAQPGSGLAAHAPDLTLLLLKREDLHPGLARPPSA